MNDSPISIFVSCGTPDTQIQESFIQAIETLLRSHGCEPQTVGRSKFSGRQPVQAARDLIGDCGGAIVIAFERSRIIKGIERPESPNPQEVANESHPTIWNQMEAAMAYAQRVPILTLIQPELKRQGMLSTRLEWVALQKELTPNLLLTDEFRQIFNEWMSYVKNRSAEAESEEIDPGKLKIGYLVKQLTSAQFAGLIGSVFAALAAVGAISFKIGQWAGPHVK